MVLIRGAKDAALQTKAYVLGFVTHPIFNSKLKRLPLLTLQASQKNLFYRKNSILDISLSLSSYSTVLFLAWLIPFSTSTICNNIIPIMKKMISEKIPNLLDPVNWPTRPKTNGPNTAANLDEIP